MADEVTTLPMSIFLDMDRTSPIPLYFQVASRIEKAISDGTVPPGTRLDNEIALGERLGLSRPTIRRAIQELVDKGLLVRRRGIGTQVVNGAVTRNVELTSLYEDLARTGRTPTTELLVHEVIPASEAIAEHLVVAPGSSVLHIQRLRGAGDVPIAVLENYLPADFADLTANDLAEWGLYTLLRGRGVAIRVARQRIGAREATVEEAHALGLERHGAVLTMERTAFDAGGRAVEWGRHVYRPDMYAFEVTLVDK